MVPDFSTPYLACISGLGPKRLAHARSETCMSEEREPGHAEIENLPRSNFGHPGERQGRLKQHQLK